MKTWHEDTTIVITVEIDWFFSASSTRDGHVAIQVVLPILLNDGATSNRHTQHYMDHSGNSQWHQNGGEHTFESSDENFSINSQRSQNYKATNYQLTPQSSYDNVPRNLQTQPNRRATNRHKTETDNPTIAPSDSNSTCSVSHIPLPVLQLDENESDEVVYPSAQSNYSGEHSNRSIVTLTRPRMEELKYPPGFPSSNSSSLASLPENPQQDVWFSNHPLRSRA